MVKKDRAAEIAKQSKKKPDVLKKPKSTQQQFEETMGKIEREKAPSIEATRKVSLPLGRPPANKNRRRAPDETDESSKKRQKSEVYRVAAPRQHIGYQIYGAPLGSPRPFVFMTFDATLEPAQSRHFIRALTTLNKVGNDVVFACSSDGLQIMAEGDANSAFLLFTFDAPFFTTLCCNEPFRVTLSLRNLCLICNCCRFRPENLRMQIQADRVELVWKKDGCGIARHVFISIDDRGEHRNLSTGSYYSPPPPHKTQGRISFEPTTKKAWVAYSGWFLSALYSCASTLEHRIGRYKLYFYETMSPFFLSTTLLYI
eukprot:GEMP01056012.1.p1 GENE.GEMP01056012.1~~GEMP01056012.1.p1  ORF type:complete len:314 (-),score=45.99 GEMP01056012.1:275-1216(-)